MNDRLCYLNGQYKPLSQAHVHVLDRGFIFGDGVYELVPVYGRRLFRFHEHMARMERSLAKLRLANPHTREQWLERCRKLVAALAESERIDDLAVYIQVTRGVAPRDHVMPEGIAPTVFMMSNPMQPPTAEQRHGGVACTTARVVASPTACALRPAYRPWRHPARATSTAYTVPLNRPTAACVSVSASTLWLTYSSGVTPKIATATSSPARQPTAPA